MPLKNNIRAGSVNVSKGKLHLREAEFAMLLEGILVDMAHEAQQQFLIQLNQRNIKLTGELQNAFRNYQINMVEKMAGYVEFSFKQYGRFKDLRYVEYRNQWLAPGNNGKKYDTANPYPDDSLPDSVQGMIKYIEMVGGLSKFKFIPGYEKSGSQPLTSRAIKRLAWTLTAHRLKLGKARQKKTEGWYIKGIMALRKQVVPEITLAVTQWLVNGTYSAEWEA